MVSRYEFRRLISAFSDIVDKTDIISQLGTGAKIWSNSALSNDHEVGEHV